MKNKIQKLLLTILLPLVVVTVAYAANISPSDKWGWGANVGWLNFAPTHGSGVMVYTNHLEGYVWAENIGWIRLNSDDTTGGSPYYANTTAGNYGVNFNNTTGELSGYAWSSNAGWINFNPSHSQVMINTTSGDFSGYAWGENIGWIKFNGTAQDATAYKVNTSSPTAIMLQSFSTHSSGGVFYLALISFVLVIGSLYLFRKRANCDSRAVSDAKK